MLAQAYEPIQDELDRVRAAMQRELEEADPRLAKVFESVQPAGGKLMRPALLLLCGRASGALDERHIAGAASVELVHCATLIHDDVIDEATERRRRSTVNARWGADLSILAGDRLFAQALALLASVATPEQLGLVTRAVSETCEGEMLQLIAADAEPPLDEGRYLAIIGKKTGALCGGACALGAGLSAQPEDVVKAFDAFGRALGVAFQIVDDCLDIRGDEEVVGKTLGTDITGGRATLPLIYAREHAPADARRHLDQTLQGPVSTEDRGHLAALLRETGAFDYCDHAARTHVQNALAKLDVVEDEAARRPLEALAEFVIRRRR
jgi:octaprenyl-diphosphate synthase